MQFKPTRDLTSIQHPIGDNPICIEQDEISKLQSFGAGAWGRRKRQGECKKQQDSSAREWPMSRRGSRRVAGRDEEVGIALTVGGQRMSPWNDGNGG